MKKRSLLLFLSSLCFLFAQIDTSWVRIYNSGTPCYSSVFKSDNLGNLYIGGWIERNETKEDFLLLKYSPNGNLIDSAFFNNPGVDDSERITAMTIDAQGFVYVTGWSKGASSFADFLVIKYNSSLDTQWVRRFAGDSFDYPSAIVVDDYGNVYVTGMSYRAEKDFDYLTIKYNPQGETLWARYYNSKFNDKDSATAIAVDEYGNVYVTGFIFYDNQEDFLTVKYNSVGETLWTKRYGRVANGEDKPLFLKLDPSGNLLVVGYTERGTGDLDVTTIKYYAPNGDTFWVRHFNTAPDNGDDWPTGIVLNPAGNIYIAGCSKRDASGDDYLTVKYDLNGNKKWHSYYNNPPNSKDCARGLSLDNQGNIYVAGNSYSPGGDFDFLVVKYDSTGKENWAKRYSSAGADNLTGIVLDNLGQIYLAGNFYGGDIAIVKYYQINDVGIDSLISPTGALLPYSSARPKVRVINYGGTNHRFTVSFKVYRGAEFIYSRSLDTTLLPQDTMILEFPGLVFTTPGNYTAKCSVALAGDENPGNNWKTNDFIVEPLTPYAWVIKAPVRSGEKNIPIKGGGSLVNCRDKSIYAFKGNNTNEFMEYVISGDSWVMKCPIPYSPEKRKRVKAGAALTYDRTDSTIYALKGNNTLEFWRYHCSGDTWHRLAKGVPGLKKIKYGSGLVYLKKGPHRYIYCLKGSKTREFYRYHIDGDSWSTLPEVPLGESQRECKAGSCLVKAGNYLFALKGYYNELFAYDYDEDTWYVKRPLPFYNRLRKKTKAKDGAAMTYDGKRKIIYLFKGGNSDEFWGYFTEADTWIELFPIPTYYPYEKKVKSGGALTYAAGNVYAFKGNKTFEFWMFSWDTTDKYKEDALVEGGKVRIKGFSPYLRIFPNPNSGRFSVSYYTPKSLPAVLKIYDVSGRYLGKIVEEEDIADFHNFPLDLSQLPSGVYFLRLEIGNKKSENYIPALPSVTEKIVIR